MGKFFLFSFMSNVEASKKKIAEVYFSDHLKILLKASTSIKLKAEEGGWRIAMTAANLYSYKDEIWTSVLLKLRGEEFVSTLSHKCKENQSWGLMKVQVVSKRAPLHQYIPTPQTPLTSHRCLVFLTVPDCSLSRNRGTPWNGPIQVPCGILWAAQIP